MTRREARELAFILLFEMSFTGEPVGTIWKMPLNPGMWRATRSPCPWRKGRRPILKRRIRSSRPFHASGTRTASPVWPCPIMRLAIYEMEHRRISRSASRSTRRSNSPKIRRGGRCPLCQRRLGRRGPQRRSRVRNRRAETITGSGGRHGIVSGAGYQHTTSAAAFDAGAGVI